jgi:hypothetical protein
MPALNRIRLTCDEGDRGSIHVKSNIDSTYQMEHRTDEDICFTDQDVVVIQNKRQDPCTLHFEAIRLPDGRRALFRPSRSAHVSLVDPEVSSIRKSIAIRLGGGESCVLTSSEFKGQMGGGARFQV